MRDSRESRLLLALLVAIAFALITVDMRSGDSSPLDGPREVAASVFGPIESGVASAVDPVGNAIAAVRESGSRHDRISELERENAELRQSLGSSEHRDSRIEQLDSMLGLAGAGQYEIIGAQVIAIGAAQGFSWTITIDAGRDDGIEPDMTVLNGDGLVGRVTTVAPSNATVLLASDPNFTVGTRLEGSDELGFATGRGDNTLDVQLLDHRARVEKGDRLVTFGSDDARPFVPGVPVGEVTGVEAAAGDSTRTVQVQPYVAFTQLDLVGVVVEPPREDPRDSVLPPLPDEAKTEEAPDPDEADDEDEDDPDGTEPGTRSETGDPGNPQDQGPPADTDAEETQPGGEEPGGYPGEPQDGGPAGDATIPGAD